MVGPVAAGSVVATKDARSVAIHPRGSLIRFLLVSMRSVRPRIVTDQVGEIVGGTIAGGVTTLACGHDAASARARLHRSVTNALDYEAMELASSFCCEGVA